MRSDGLWICLLLCQVTPSFFSKSSSLRLPHNLKPLHYRLKLVPSFQYHNFITLGEVRISLQCLEDTRRVVFNSKGITIKEIQLTKEEYKNDLSNLSYDDEKEMHYALFNDKLNQGETYELYIKFKYVLNDLLQGFYKSKYQLSSNNQSRWIATTQFSPTDARRAFPCWDEPSFKALFTITIGRHANMTSLSNMPLQSSTEMPNKLGWYWDKFETSLPMSTYLVAFMVIDFAYVVVPTKKKNFTLRFWSREEAAKQTKYVSKIAPKLLSYFEDYFNISFPLPKLDMVALPDFGFSGMENWGLITFRESAMLIEEKEDNWEEKLYVGEVVAHEIAHQWFGNLVTPAWWEDLWLKEGFASYMEQLALHKIEPDSNHMGQFVIKTLQKVLHSDSLQSSHKICNPVEDPKDIRQMFDVISYKKGASIIRMMHHMIGDAEFQKGVTRYLEQHSLKNANQSDLWVALVNGSSVDKDNNWLARTMDSWTLQTGYPVVTVTRNYTDQTATFYQNRFILSGELVPFASWWVPITYTYCSQLSQASTDPIFWLTPNENFKTIDEIPSNDCLLVNINSTGFYRVNYDKENWNLIIDKFPHFPDLLQSQLLSDSLSLSQSGHLSYEVVFTMVKHLKDSHHYLSWSTASLELSFIYYLLRSYPLRDHYQRFVLSLLPMDRLYLASDDSKKESLFEKKLRFLQVQLAGKLEGEGMIKQAVSLLEKIMYLDSPNGTTIPKVESDLLCTLYCLAISAGSDKEWNFVWEMYLKSNVGAERETLMKALTCTKNTSTITKYLNYLLDSKSGLRKQDGSLIFHSLIKNDHGTDQAVDFLFSKWEQFLQYYGLAFNKVSDMVTSLGYLNNESQLQKVENFYKKLKSEKKLGTTGKSFLKAIESIRINVNWLTSRLNEFTTFLNRIEI